MRKKRINFYRKRKLYLITPAADWQIFSANQVAEIGLRLHTQSLIHSDENDFSQSPSRYYDSQLVTISLFFNIQIIHNTL